MCSRWGLSTSPHMHPATTTMYVADCLAGSPTLTPPAAEARPPAAARAVRPTEGQHIAAHRRAHERLQVSRLRGWRTRGGRRVSQHVSQGAPVQGRAIMQGRIRPNIQGAGAQGLPRLATTSAAAEEEERLPMTSSSDADVSRRPYGEEEETQQRCWSYTSKEAVATREGRIHSGASAQTRSTSSPSTRHWRPVRRPCERAQHRTAARRRRRRDASRRAAHSSTNVHTAGHEQALRVARLEAARVARDGLRHVV